MPDAGDTIAVTLSDPAGEVLVGGTEHDSYAAGSRLSHGTAVGGDLAFQVVYRRSIGSVVAEGLQVALGSPLLLLSLGLTVGAAGLLLSGALRHIRGLDLGALLSAALGGGLLFASMLGLAAAALHLHPTPALGLSAAITMGLLGSWLWSRPPAPSIKLDYGAVGLVVCLVFFGALRLAFASPLSLPPHINSLQHYLVISDLLTPERAPLAANTVGDLSLRYYHLGFHALAAWVLALAGSGTAPALLVLGQLLQAVAVGAVYFPVYAAVRDTKAALASVILAGIGWSMPGYAGNWAKYPAVLGLAGLATAVGLLLLAMRERGSRRIALSIAVSVSVLAAALIHTRMLILFATFMLSLAVARRLASEAPNRYARVRGLIPIAVGLLGVAALLLVSTPTSLDQVRRSLATFTVGQGGLSTVVVLFLVPFALRWHRSGAVASLSWMALLLACEFLPPNASYPLPLIDAPLARMAVFLPLCSLGGLGASGVNSMLRSGAPGKPFARLLRAGAALGVLAYLARSLAAQSYAPAECCILARQDDLAIARLALARLPGDALVLVPSQASDDPNAGPSGVDGGGWLFALDHIRTVKASAKTDLALAAQHSLLCAQRITHVYVGGTSWGFSRVVLDLAPAFYTPELVLPGAAIYSVIGCDSVQSEVPAAKFAVRVPGIGRLQLNVPHGASSSTRRGSPAFNCPSRCCAWAQAGPGGCPPLAGLLSGHPLGRTAWPNDHA